MFGKIRAAAAFHESFGVCKCRYVAFGSHNQVCRHLLLVLIASECDGDDLFSVDGFVRQYHSHCIERGMIHIIGCDILKTDIAQGRSEGLRGSIGNSSDLKIYAADIVRKCAFDPLPDDAK